MKSLYFCPHCDQKSTRRWNLETHIIRKHGGMCPFNHRSITGSVVFLDGRNVLGYKGHMCKKSLSWVIEEIHDDEKRLLKPNHTCDSVKLQKAQSVTDIPRTIHKQRQELIFYLTLACTNNIYNQQELVGLTAVGIPPSVFDKQSDSHEEYVDLDSLPSGIPDWVHHAVKEGRTFVPIYI
jgi:hypothetical protein